MSQKGFAIERHGTRVHVVGADAVRGGSWVCTIAIPLRHVEALALALLEQVHGPLGSRAIVEDAKAKATKSSLPE
jgi:hypothetical protein